MSNGVYYKVTCHYTIYPTENTYAVKVGKVIVTTNAPKY